MYKGVSHSRSHPRSHSRPHTHPHSHPHPRTNGYSSSTAVPSYGSPEHRKNQAILAGLPSTLELCNEQIIHNKIHSSVATTATSTSTATATKLVYNYQAKPPTMMRLIPRGRKAILWFRKTPHGCETLVIMKKMERYGAGAGVGASSASGTGTSSSDTPYGHTKFIPSNEIYHYTACFHPLLCSGRYGTILYGTLVSITSSATAGNVRTIFSTEDILCFQGTTISAPMATWNERIALISVVMRNTRMVGYLEDVAHTRRTATAYGDSASDDTSSKPKDIVIMSPITVGISYTDTYSARKQISSAIYQAYETLESQLGDLPYVCFAVQLMRGDDYKDIYSNVIGGGVGVGSGVGVGVGVGIGGGDISTRIGTTATATRTATGTAIFTVVADVREDIYTLYAASSTPVGTANIPDYKTSVMMNSLFRNIKENRNLDALEESDDEDEFEDTREDKYVDTTKRINMVCEYSAKYRSWIPRRIAEKGEVPTSMPMSHLGGGMSGGNGGERNRDAFRPSRTYSPHH